MAKNKKYIDIFLVVLMAVTGIAVGGLFIDGTTLANPILKFIPEQIHTFVGWVLMIGTAVGAFLNK